MAIIGYARVSTDGQTVEAQKQALQTAGADRVFAETASGARTDRRELARALKALTAGDTLLATRLDRLARLHATCSTSWTEWRKPGPGFGRSPISGPTPPPPHGRLILTVLGGPAEFERELIRSRTSEGRLRAKARGTHMGRPARLTRHQREEALEAISLGTATQADLARRFNVHQATISRLVRLGAS